MEDTCSFEEVEFMRKKRFESIKSKFSEISEDAITVINEADDNDVIKLTLTINSPMKITEAEIYTEDKFIELAF